MAGNLANYGRGGDTQIRKVDGKESHVNIWESYLIDSFGKEGEDVVKKIGSGDTNPFTGMTEYQSRLSKWLGRSKRGKKLRHWWRGRRSKASKATGGTWQPSKGQFGWFGVTKKGRQRYADTGSTAPMTSAVRKAEEAARKKEKQSKSILGKGARALEQEYEAAFGEGGYIGKQEDIAIETAERGFEDRMATMRETAYGALEGSRAAKSKSGFATSGEIQAREDRAMGGIAGARESSLGALQSSIDSAKLATEKQTADLKASMADKMNQLLLGYTQATDKVYGGSAFEDIESDLNL